MACSALHLANRYKSVLTENRFGVGKVSSGQRQDNTCSQRIALAGSAKLFRSFLHQPPPPPPPATNTHTHIHTRLE